MSGKDRYTPAMASDDPPVDDAAVEAQKDRIMERVDQLIAARDELRTELAEARASLERVEVECNNLSAERDRARRERDEAVARAEKAEIEVGRLQKILEQNTEWREGYAYGVSKLDEIAAPYKARAEKAERERDELRSQRPPAG